jgi:hypothetical protein
MCENFKYCIYRALEYAKKNDYSSANSSFMSDIEKFKCTECIKSPFLLAILLSSKKNVKDYEDCLLGFSIRCNCSK